MAWILRIRRKWVTLFRPKHTEKAEEDMEDRWLTVDEICEYLDCIGISFFRQDRQDVQDIKKIRKSC